MAISAAAYFLTLSAREPDVTNRAAFHRAAAAVHDWPAALAAAEHHRLSALVDRACLHAGLTLPPSVQETLRDHARQALAQTLMLDAELARLTAALAARALPLLVLKGPVLARTLYPNLALRPYGDLDLTVPATHAAAAIAVLIACGYREVPYAAEEARCTHAHALPGGAAFHRQFAHGRTGAVVELHLDPLQLGLQPLCETGRWQRAQPVPGLVGAVMLAPEDQLVQLAVHAHKHGFERLIWLKDIDLLLRSHGPTLDWDLVATVARQEGVSASVWYTLQLTGRLLATPGAETASKRMQPGSVVRRLYRLVWPEGRIANLHGRMRRRAVQFHAAESVRGMLPTIVLMGRRRERVRALLSQVWQR